MALVFLNGKGRRGRESPGWEAGSWGSTLSSTFVGIVKTSLGAGVRPKFKSHIGPFQVVGFWSSGSAPLGL